MILKQYKTKKWNAKKDIFLPARNVIYVKENQNSAQNAEDANTVIKPGVAYANTW